MTALHHAAMKGELEILQMLIEAGCELNTQDKVSTVCPRAGLACPETSVCARLSYLEPALLPGFSYLEPALSLTTTRLQLSGNSSFTRLQLFGTSSLAYQA